MVRIIAAVTAKRRKKRLLKQAKGQFGKRSRNFCQAKRSVIKGLSYAFRDRKAKKREYRRLWIVRINAACQEAGITYSRFIKGLSSSGIVMNRKMLSEVAISSPEAFQKLIKISQDAKPSPANRVKKSASVKASSK